MTRRVDRSIPAAPDAWTQMLEFAGVRPGQALLQYSPEARDITTRSLRKKRLPPDLADEIIGEVLSSFFGTVERNPDKAIPQDKIAAEFQRICSRRIADYWRGERGGKEERRDPILFENRAADQRLPEDENPPDVTWLNARIGQYRVTIEALGKKPETVSGAFTWLALVDDDSIPVDDAPAPTSGVEKDRAYGWPALWFATRDRSFFASSSAANRRRANWIKQIENLRDLAKGHLVAGIVGSGTP
jgi:hypothetical protein